MNHQALQTIVRFATDKIETRPVSQQIEIYNALAELLPDREERLTAARIAFAIQETTKLQMDFHSALCPPPPMTNSKCSMLNAQ